MNMGELALFVRLWKEGRGGNLDEVAEIFKKPHCSIITTSTPDRLSTFILDFLTYGENSVGIYKVTACGSTWVATITTDGGKLTMNTRDEKIFNTEDGIRLLRTFAASVEYSVVLMAGQHPRVYSDDLHGELLFEEDLLIIGKGLINAISPLFSDAEFRTGQGDYRLGICKMTAGHYRFSLRHMTKTQHTEASEPVLQFCVTAQGKLGKEPYTIGDRGYLLSILREFGPSVHRDTRKPKESE
jgi:hypothetical protein